LEKSDFFEALKKMLNVPQPEIRFFQKSDFFDATIWAKTVTIVGR